MNYLKTEAGEKLLTRYLKRFEGKSSLKVYRSEINQFFRFFEGDLAEIKEADLTRYRDSLGKKANPKTVKRKFSIINGFLKYAEKHVTGYQSPIGKERGDLVQYSAVDYTESESFQKLLNGFLSGIIKEKSRATYRNHLIQSFRYLGREPRHITTVDLIDYHTALMREVADGSRAPTGVWGRFMALQKFFADYARRDKGFENPIPNYRTIPGLEPPEKALDRTSPLTLDELGRLFKTIRKDKNLRSLRDHAFFKLQFYLALRISEACNLRYGDLVQNGSGWNWQIRIRKRKGKTGREKDTLFELIREVSEPLEKWIEASRYPFSETTPVFLPTLYRDHAWEIDRKRARKNRPLTTRVMQGHFVTYLKEAGIDPERGDKTEDNGRVRTHSLRATMATLLTDSNVQPVYLQNFLGQSPPGQLKVYVKYNFIEHNPLTLLRKNSKIFQRLKRF